MMLQSLCINVLLTPYVQKKRHLFTIRYRWCWSGRQLFLDSWLDILMTLWKIIACDVDGLISSKSFHLLLWLYRINHILFHSDIYSKVRRLAFEKHSFTDLDYLHSEWWRRGFLSFQNEYFSFHLGEILGEYVILTVEGCSLIQYAMKYNWYLFVSLSVSGFYSNIRKTLRIFIRTKYHWWAHLQPETRS